MAGEAGSGDETVALARGGCYDVILMDLRMPGTDGVDAIGRLMAGDPAARIVVLTTYETDADIELRCVPWRLARRATCSRTRPAPSPAGDQTCDHYCGPLLTP